METDRTFVLLTLTGYRDRNGRDICYNTLVSNQNRELFYVSYDSALWKAVVKKLPDLTAEFLSDTLSEQLEVVNV